MAVKAESNNLKPVPFYVLPATMDVLRVATLGTVAGLLIPLFGMLIANYLVSPVFCTQSTDGICSSPLTFGYHMSALVIGAVAVFALVKFNVYRGLIIILATTIAMWGLRKYAADLPSVSTAEFIAFSTVLHGLSYPLFYWVLRIRNFVLSLILTIAIIALVCWALAA